MLIAVIFSDNSPGYARPEDLSEMILNRKIIFFRRSGQWVKVGFEPVRGEGGEYKGPDRRID